MNNGSTREELAKYKGRRVLVTGHTGFKGIWLTKLLLKLGAEVTGYALVPDSREGQAFFEKAAIVEFVKHIIGDIRDLTRLQQVFGESQPEIVLHLAAQPIVSEGYRNPVDTYSTNIMGTVNLLECVRNTPSVTSVVNITTDKVYENKEWDWGYRESDRLGAGDPYATSKACAELVTASYRKSYFASETEQLALSTARAGNVIGGGDVALNRIIPDCIRAAVKGEPIKVRSPRSIRPYQHVIEPIVAYLLLAIRQESDMSLAGAYNIGPDSSDAITTGELVELFCRVWGEGLNWESTENCPIHEAGYLKLDPALIKRKLGIKPCWSIRAAISRTVEFAKADRAGENISALMLKQLDDYLRQADSRLTV